MTMVDGSRLLGDLHGEVRALEADLRADETDIARLRVEWEHARDAGRIAATFDTWLDDSLTQAAVAWVLGSVLVRFCEDNGLIDGPFLAAPGSRLTLARERQHAYFRRHVASADRDWIVEALAALETSPTTVGMFGALHMLMERHPISHDAAGRLIAFWRAIGSDGQLARDFTDTRKDTRFLGDLYQDLSDSARAEYALVQTPEFVAEFILKYTLDPALEKFGLEPAPPTGHDDLPRVLRVIDPVCGSGTFLLGIFRRSLSAWQDRVPGLDAWTAVTRALASVHGVDKNPTAVVICRFRLLVAAMEAAGAQRISEVPELPITVAAGDSLIPRELSSQEWPAEGNPDKPYYDIDQFAGSPHRLLAGGSYHAVVGNPPYITVKDARESARYRSIYPASTGRYSLAVTFTERFFRLAHAGTDQAGYVGMLVANSFMKREFGRKLVEEFLPGVDLTHVIDTSGAYIPGHGTPTVILLGRQRMPRLSATVRTVLGIRGEPSEPPKSSKGFVWQAIDAQVGHPGSESEWISVADVDRAQFACHPWTLASSAATGLLAKLERATPLEEVAARIGYYATTGADDAFTAPVRVLHRDGAESEATREVVTGADVRDWQASPSSGAFFPGALTSRVPSVAWLPLHLHRLWPYRTVLRSRSYLGLDLATRGLPWYGWHQVSSASGAHPWLLVYPWVATHPHFAVIRDGSVPLQSAPVIQLPETATDTEFFGLLGALNSSACCFWLKQHSQAKGAPRADQLRAEESWEYIHEYATAVIRKLPLPAALPVELGRAIESLARDLAQMEPAAVCAARTPTREQLDAARDDWDRIRGRMIALQEELDWCSYHGYGLMPDEEAPGLLAAVGAVPEIQPGERAFEIVLARRMRDEGFETQWFDRHRSMPVTEIPVRWPDEYKAVVERRIAVIRGSRDLGLIERPEFKRRWQSQPWPDKQREALTTWLLDRCEQRALWFGSEGQPQPLTVNQLADRLRQDADVVSVARLLMNDPDADLAKVLTEIIADEHVPYLAQFRYKAEGMLKHARWQQVWALQREEDATGRQLDIPVPPRYASTDFQRPAYWRNRGKLDVSRERFISYPGASPDSDGSLMLGWAGWDYHERAQALYTLIEERQNVDGWQRDRIVALLAGLAEVMPWIPRWHNAVDPAFGHSPADQLDAYLSAQCERHGLTEEALRSWTAPPVRRGRPPKARRSGVRVPRDPGRRG